MGPYRYRMLNHEDRSAKSQYMGYTGNRCCVIATNVCGCLAQAFSERSMERPLPSGTLNLRYLCHLRCSCEPKGLVWLFLATIAEVPPVVSCYAPDAVDIAI